MYGEDRITDVIEILRIKYEWEMMRRMNVLTLSASISNWIILADILNTTTDRPTIKSQVDN